MGYVSAADLRLLTFLAVGLVDAGWCGLLGQSKRIYVKDVRSVAELGYDWLMRGQKNNPR